MQKIAAVISTFNQGADIKPTIESLLKQTSEIDKIVIVDDGSDKGKKAPKFTNKKIFSKYLKKNIGVVWGRNYGLSLLKEYDYVLIIDDDIILESGALKELLDAFKDNLDCAASMPVVYFKGDKGKVWSSGSGVNLLTGQTIFFTEAPRKKFTKIPAATSVLLVDMKKLRSSGWYDPIYYFCYEDADFYYRLREGNNGDIYCVRDAKAYHDTPLGSESLSKVATRSYHIARGRIIFLSRYGKFFPLNVVFVLVFALYYFYLGMKFNQPKAGFRFLIGIMDGLKLVVGNKASRSMATNYSGNISLKQLNSPSSLRSYGVKQ